MSKESKRGTGGDFPESLAGGSGMATVSGDDFDRRVKSLVEEILRSQMTRTPAPRPGKSTGGAVAGMGHICCIIVVVSSVCLYWLNVGGAPMGSLLSFTFYIGCCEFEGGVGYGAN